MTSATPLTVAVIAGEESGDLLGADLMKALRRQSGREVRLIGVGGRHLQEFGLSALFDGDDIALMGISAVLRDLPRLIKRIGQAARAVAAAKPDCLITVDSPDFGLRVAGKVRALNPAIPIIHYVCPSVWAWRPGRARAMKPYVDHVLCVLPFEPAELERLGGPPGTFVGHRLLHDPDVQAAAAAQSRAKASGREKTLLLLPGSRRSEVVALIEPFRETVAELERRNGPVHVLLPTVPHIADLVAASTAGWARKPEIIRDPAGKWRAFAEADAALAASGTVALELALAHVPTVICYKTDLLVRMLYRHINLWSASLPNIIADRPIVPEHFDHFIKPRYLARQLENLMSDTLTRRAQIEGFEEVARRMMTQRPAGELAAEVVLRRIAGRN